MFLFTVFDVPPGNLKVTYVAYTIFLLDGAGLEVFSLTM